VLTLDWRGFGDSDGELPGAGTSLEAFLTFIRGTWMGDAEASLTYLRSRPGVDGSRIGTMGSSCGMLMSLELAAAHPEIKVQVLVTGPVDDIALEQLRESSGLPRLGILPRDDPSFEYMRQIEEVILPDAGRMFYVPDGAGHGSEIFDNYPEVRGMVAHWFSMHLGEG
jgi:pimeloyl-ACP methyl ester carboxylesterase